MIVANIVPLALVILMNCMVCNFGKAVAAFKPISTTSSNTRAVTSLLRVSQYEHCLRTDRRLALFRLFSSTIENPPVESVVPLVLAEGLFAVDKPLEWTSQDVVSFIRGILERDCRSRGAIPGKVGKANSIKVGHGGTLDPLATGVLVIGVGSGTKELTTYVSKIFLYPALSMLIGTFN